MCVGMVYLSISGAWAAMVGCTICFSLIFLIDISELLPQLTRLIFTLFMQASHKVQFGHHYYLSLLPSVVKHILHIKFAHTVPQLTIF